MVEPARLWAWGADLGTGTADLAEVTVVKWGLPGPVLGFQQPGGNRWLLGEAASRTGSGAVP